MTPSSSPQTVTLPATGGISGTISFGAYPSGATGCDSITISTGADVDTTLSSARSGLAASTEANGSAPTPILTISVGEAFGSNGGPVSAFGYQTIISGMQLTVSPNLNFPNGTYYATVTVAGQTFVIPFTAKGGVLTVSAGDGSLPITILADSSALISLYKMNVIPPTPTPTSSASAAPTATPQPVGTATGQPVPDGTTIGSSTYTGSGYPPDLSYLNGVTTTTPIVYYASNPELSVGPSQVGTTSYTIAGIGAESYRVDGCAGRVSYGGNGASGTLTLPYGVTYQYSDTCTIYLFSAPASVVNAAPNNGFGYTVYTIIGPVGDYVTTYPPAQNI